MAENKGFTPDWISPPGDTVADILEERNLSPQELARLMGRPVKLVEELLHGRATLTAEIARQFEAILGTPAAFWSKREAQYRNALGQAKKRGRISNECDWLKEIPLKDMIKFGWISENPTDPVAECLDFFNMKSIEEWREKNQSMSSMAVFRTSTTFQSQPGAVSAWLRQGEIESELIDCEPWDAQRFSKKLSVLRSLTRKEDPDIFVPQLTQHCAECGVAVVVLRAPAGCRASGATRFLSTRKALLLLSVRHLSDDHFWFTFFHEAGHLLLHGKQAVFLEGFGMVSPKEEQEANEFSANVLIPPQYHSELMKLRADHKDVMRFARKIDVSRGVVVGQLQHRGIIARNQLNSLKTRFTWNED